MAEKQPVWGAADVADETEEVSDEPEVDQRLQAAQCIDYLSMPG